MFYLRGSYLLFKVLMTFEAEFAVRFDQQPFHLGRVRVVARETLAVLYRLMFELGGFRGRIVALETQGRRSLCEHLRDCRAVRIMAGGTFGVLHWLMFN